MSVAIPNDMPALLAADRGSDAEVQERRQVELAARGDAMAFRAIVERHHAGLFVLASRLMREPAEAEDAVQETFARAYCAIDRFDPTYRLSTWLYRIAVNVCRDAWRSGRAREQREAKESESLADHDTREPEALLAARRRALAVREALDQLRPAYREILVLKDMQELSYEEIHVITGAPITALKIRAIRARQKLRKLLGERP